MDEDVSAVEGFGFFGEYEHSVDDKGRIVFPLDFRAPLGDEFVVTRGPNRAILVCPIAVWKPIEEKLKEPVLDRHTNLLQRMMLGRSFVKLDPQSRLAIPKYLRE